jgi:hypothetical protein
MGRLVSSGVLLSLFAALAFGADAPPRWQVFAGCAAAYKANWLNRLADRSRAPAMSTMIDDTATQYRLIAIGHYRKEKTATRDEANRSVEAYVETNIARFVAMDQAGTLEAFIDACPQTEEP